MHLRINNRLLSGEDNNLAIRKQKSGGPCSKAKYRGGMPKA